MKRKPDGWVIFNDCGSILIDHHGIGPNNSYIKTYRTKEGAEKEELVFHHVKPVYIASSDSDEVVVPRELMLRITWCLVGAHNYHTGRVPEFMKSVKNQAGALLDELKKIWPEEGSEK